MVDDDSMKHINFPVPEEDWEYLKKQKDGRSWHQFLMDAAVAEERAGQTWKEFFIEQIKEEHKE